MNKVKKEEIGVLIAVRMKSSRLRSKAFGDITGKPLIVHLIERMKRVAMAGKVILCTSTHPDDRVLLDIARQEGILAFAGSELDVMKRFIDAAEQNHLKIVVRTTGDNPLTDPENIDRMIRGHLEGGFEFTKSEYLPIGMNAEVISVETLKKAYDTAEDTSLTEYMTTYLKRPDIYKVHVIENNDPFYANRALIRLTVDYENDLQLVNRIYKEFYAKKPAFTVRDVLEFLDKNPELLKMNDDLPQIPLPKIRYKGEKKHDKTLILLGKDLQGTTKTVIDAVRSIDLLEIVGFAHDSSSIEFSIIDGIPILGRCQDIEKIQVKADYAFSTFADPVLRKKYNERLAARGFFPLKIIAPDVQIPADAKIGLGVFIGKSVKIGKGAVISDNVFIYEGVSIPDGAAVSADQSADHILK